MKQYLLPNRDGDTRLYSVAEIQIKRVADLKSMVVGWTQNTNLEKETVDIRIPGTTYKDIPIKDLMIFD